MARFHSEVLVEAPTRHWFEEYARSLIGHAESLTPDGDGRIQGDADLAGVTLVEGEHLTAGARYRLRNDPIEGADGGGTTSEVVITAWEPGREVSAAITTRDPGGDSTDWTLKLGEPLALESVAVDGTHRSAEPAVHLSWTVRLDCRRWWELAAGATPARRAGAPLTAQLIHRLGQGRLWLSPSAAGDGQWRLHLTLAVRGRGWLRPFAAVVLLFMRRTLRTEVGEVVAEIAEDWNKNVTEVRELDPRAGDPWLPQLRTFRAELDRWLDEDR